MTVVNEKTGRKQWQNNWKLSKYLEEVREVFGEAEMRTADGVIMAFVPPSTAKTNRETAGAHFLYQGAEGDEKAVTWMNKAGKLFVTAFKGGADVKARADASSHPHEIAHAWQILGLNRAIPEAERTSKGVGGAYDFEIDAIEKSLGVIEPDGFGAGVREWTTEQHEQLAVWHEAFVLEGKISRAVDAEGNPLLNDRDFEILQVAMARMSEKVSKVYHAADLKKQNIPPAIREIFEVAHQRGSVDEVMQSLGDEARAVYQQITIGTAKGFAGSRTETQERLKTTQERYDVEHPGWREDESVLPRGKKGNLSRLTNEIERQENVLNDIKIGAAKDLYQHRYEKERALKSYQQELDEKYPGGWEQGALPDYELTELKKRQAALARSEKKWEGFASEFMEEELERTAREGGQPINISRIVGNKDAWDDIAGRDDVRDIFENYVAITETDLKNHSLTSAEAIKAESEKVYENMTQASRKEAKALMKEVDKGDKQGIRFRAYILGMRKAAADIFRTLEDKKAQILANRENGVNDPMVIHDFLFYTSLFEPMAHGLKMAAYHAGGAMASMGRNMDPYGSVINRATSPEEAASAIAAVEKQLDLARGDGNIDNYLDRLFTSMSEGQYQFMKVVNPGQKVKLDHVLEAFYNSILSGPRTHAVNTLSNTIYGTLLHVERKVGSFAMRKLRGDPSYPKHVAAVVTMREMLKDSFTMARVALREGSAQLDPNASRTIFDEQTGVFSGTQTKDWAKALGVGGLQSS